MNNSAKRIGLAAIAAFYVVFGGLWAVDYFPLKGFYNDIETGNRLAMELGSAGTLNCPECDRAFERRQAYAVSHPSIAETEEKLALYQAILLWGTVAIGVGGGVLLLTRRRSTDVGKGEAE